MQDSANKIANKAPIEYMRLVVHIRTPEALRASSLSRFATKWMEKYPQITEQPPLPGSHLTSEFEFLDDDNYWPMPFTVFSSPLDGRGIMFQADRVGVFWDGSPSADRRSQYPGYQIMKNTLLEVLSDFAAFSAQGNNTIEPVSVECLYQNQLKNLLPHECVMGRLTGWKDDALREGIQLDASTSFNVHEHSENDDNFPVWISMRPDEDNHSTMMMLRSVVTEEVNGSLEERVIHLIDTAHRVATDQYVHWVSPEIREDHEGSA